MTRGTAFVVALGCASPVLAQSEPRQPEIVVDPNGPGAHIGESTRVPLPPEGPGRDAFMREFIRVNPRDNVASVGTRELTAYEFYQRVNRQDLATRADERTRQRVWLISGSILTLGAGVAGGAVVLGNVQNLNDPVCFVSGSARYNQCVDRAQKTQLTGAVIVVAGVVVAASLLTWALLIPEMVTSPEETVHLATDHNRDLARQHGGTGQRLQIVPSIGPGGAALSLRLAF